MASNIEYDDSNLQKMFAELEPKRRMQAIKGGFRRLASKVRKRAVANLRQDLHSNRDLEKGVRALVYKRKAGFRVTVGTKKANKNGRGERGMHTNRRGLKKPVLIWAEDGTTWRKTKGNGGKRAARLRAAHSTGMMCRYGFIERTREQEKGSVTDDMRRMVKESVIRISKKYGCK